MMLNYIFMFFHMWVQFLRISFLVLFSSVKTFTLLAFPVRSERQPERPVLSSAAAWGHLGSLWTVPRCTETILTTLLFNSSKELILLSTRINNKRKNPAWTLHRSQAIFLWTSYSQTFFFFLTSSYIKYGNSMWEAHY